MDFHRKQVAGAWFVSAVVAKPAAKLAHSQRELVDVKGDDKDDDVEQPVMEDAIALSSPK